MQRLAHNCLIDDVTVSGGFLCLVVKTGCVAAKQARVCNVQLGLCIWFMFFFVDQLILNVIHLMMKVTFVVDLKPE